MIENNLFRWTVKTWWQKDQDWAEIGRRTDEVNAAFEAKGLSLGFLKDGKLQGG